MKRKLLSVLLLVCALATLLTVSAFADDESPTSPQPTTYTLKFHNGETVVETWTTTGDAYSFDDAIIGRLKAVSNPGSKLLGWATSPAATSAMFGSGFTRSLPNTYTDLYAVWQGYNYSLSFDAKEGSGAPAAMGETGVVSYTIPSTVPKRDGYDFAGWTDGTTTYRAGDTYTFAGDKGDESVTLEAVWELKTYTLTFYNGETKVAERTTKTVEDEKTVYTFDDAFINGLKAITKEDHTLLGWSRTPGATDADIGVGFTYSLADNVTALYAVWEANNSTGGETGGETGGQTGGQTGGETGGQTGGETGGQTGGETGGQTGGETGGETGGQTGGEQGKPDEPKKDDAGAKGDEPKTEQKADKPAAATGTDSKTLPKTGDESQLGLWIVLASVSAMIGGGVLLARKKHNED